LLISPPSIIPWLMIVLVFLGLAVRWFETPLSRAFTLGLLQALYILMGALAGSLSLGLMLISAMFFFSMFAGRGLTDIRDYPMDVRTRVQTLPKHYGIQKTAVFIFLGLLIAHSFGLSVWLTGEFNINFLFFMLCATAVGLVTSAIFLFKPSPQLARQLTSVYMVGEGILVSLALILGSL
jgi:4-hydroxybenzoate polyprenyltransferase